MLSPKMGSSVLFVSSCLFITCTLFVINTCTRKNCLSRFGHKMILERNENAHRSYACDFIFGFHWVPMMTPHTNLHVRKLYLLRGSSRPCIRLMPPIDGENGTYQY